MLKLQRWYKIAALEHMDVYAVMQRFAALYQIDLDDAITYHDWIKAFEDGKLSRDELANRTSVEISEEIQAPSERSFDSYEDMRMFDCNEFAAWLAIPYYAIMDEKTYGELQNRAYRYACANYLDTDQLNDLYVEIANDCDVSSRFVHEELGLRINLEAICLAELAHELDQASLAFEHEFDRYYEDEDKYFNPAAGNEEYELQAAYGY